MERGLGGEVTFQRESFNKVFILEQNAARSSQNRSYQLVQRATPMDRKVSAVIPGVTRNLKCGGRPAYSMESSLTNYRHPRASGDPVH